MSSHVVANNQPYDQVIIDIVDYALNYEITSPVAYETAWSSFLDTVGWGLESLE
jgi:2-methylcitrate dehydratase